MSKVLFYLFKQGSQYIRQVMCMDVVFASSVIHWATSLILDGLAWTVHVKCCQEENIEILYPKYRFKMNYIFKYVVCNVVVIEIQKSYLFKSNFAS